MGDGSVHEAEVPGVVRRGAISCTLKFRDEISLRRGGCNDPDFIGIFAGYLCVIMCCHVWFKLFLNYLFYFYVNNFELIRIILFGVFII